AVNRHRRLPCTPSSGLGRRADRSSPSHPSPRSPVPAGWASALCSSPRRVTWTSSPGRRASSPARSWWPPDSSRTPSRAGPRPPVDLWFAEEREHARLLGAAVARFGGRCIQGHWSFTAFCLTRRWFGVRFELTVLLLTEIVSTVYYRLLRRHGQDPALRAMCR